MRPILLIALCGPDGSNEQIHALLSLGEHCSTWSALQHPSMDALRRSFLTENASSAADEQAASAHKNLRHTFTHSVLSTGAIFFVSMQLPTTLILAI